MAAKKLTFFRRSSQGHINRSVKVYHEKSGSNFSRKPSSKRQREKPGSVQNAEDSFEDIKKKVKIAETLPKKNNLKLPGATQEVKELLHKVGSIFKNYFSPVEQKFSQLDNKRLKEIIHEISEQIGERVKDGKPIDILIEIAGKLAEKVEIEKFMADKDFADTFKNQNKKRILEILEKKASGNIKKKIAELRKRLITSELDQKEINNLIKEMEDTMPALHEDLAKLKKSTVQYFTSNTTADDGRQITDLIIAVKEGENLVILAMVEVKKKSQVNEIAAQHVLSLDRLVNQDKGLHLSDGITYNKSQLIFYNTDFLGLVERGSSAPLRSKGLRKSDIKEVRGSKKMFAEHIGAVLEKPYQTGAHDNAAELIYNYLKRKAAIKK